MDDIVQRLRKWSISTHAVPASDIMDEAADEIERLRLTEAEPVAWAVIIPLTPGRYAIDDFFVSHSRAAEACDWRKQNTPRGAEIVPLYRQPQPKLTDAEREAVDMAIDLLNGVEDVSAGASSRADAAAATLRGLLERTK